MAKHHESEARSKLLDWINGTLLSKGWKPYTWTLKAGLSDTSLTRFLNRPDTAPLPSATTIVALAQAADSNPILLQSKKIALGRNVPLLEGKLLTLLISCPRDMDSRTLEEDMGQWTDRRVAVVSYSASHRAFGVEVETRSMNAAGILPGDHLIVEPVEICPPRLGDTVIILCPDGKICPMRFQTPWLTPVTTDTDLAPLLIENTQVHGVVMQMSRPCRRGERVPLAASNGKEVEEVA